MFATYKRVFWLSALMSVFVFAPFYVTGFSTDVWTHLIRIREWVAAGFPWREQLLMSYNFPFGDEMHWTRPLDIIGYIFAWPFIPGWGLKRALEIMAAFTPILFLIVGVRGFFFGLRGYLTPRMAFLAFWLFFWGIGYGWGQSLPGYFDQHVFHFALLLWCIGLILRSFRVKENAGCLVWSGILGAIGTWITADFFVNLYILSLPFALGWLIRNMSLKPLLLFFGSYTLVLGGVMLFDHPIGGFFSLEGEAIFSGFYLNELLVRLLPREETFEGLFGSYVQTLKNLAQQDANHEVGLRTFELDLLESLGYGLPDTGEDWYWDGEELKPCDERRLLSERHILIEHAMIDRLRQRDLRLKETQAFAKKLLREMITHYAGDRPLNTRRILQELRRA